MRRLTVPPFEGLDPYLPRPVGSDRVTREQVAAILDAVRTRGDSAIREYTRSFDRLDLEPPEWELGAQAWQAALQRVSAELRNALAAAADRVRVYHEYQRDRGFTLNEP